MHTTIKLCFATCLLAISRAAAAEAVVAEAPLMHAMFSDHAVLQRDAPIPVYGVGVPNETIHLSLAAGTAEARADAEGRWTATLPALPAGGPYTLTAQTANGRKQRVNDVMIGDVWLCSGQSNMVLQVHRTLDARAEIAGSANDRIRMLRIGETGSVIPLPTFATAVQWQKAAPATAAEFSATCFYFARELQKSIDVPMGLIVAAWGGSRIQSWIAGPALRGLHRYDAALDVLARYADDPVSASAQWGRLWANWWRDLPERAAGDEPWLPDAPAGAAWLEAPVALGAWERWGVPALAEFNGMLWYRATVRLNAAQAQQEAVLALAAADELDTTWVNGVGVGSSYGADPARAYRLPKGLLHAGDNVVVVNVLDTYKDGGLAGPAGAHALRFADGTSAPLVDWRYRAVPAETASPPRAPWHTAGGLSTLHNGMIEPIGRYAMRGFVWYQGESNTFEPEQYGDLLATLIADWRVRFGAGLPFLNVQLAGYGAAPTAPVESGWAELREVQRRFAERDGRYGAVVAIDIGDRYDIHPPNKQEVGRRLSRLARHLVYGDTELSAVGPVPVSARRDGDAVAVRFTDITGGLVALGADGPIGFELCGAAKGSCRYAQARIRGEDVLLRAANLDDAVRVRYGWADSPVVTLFDGAGLPAGPFEFPIERDATP